MSDFDVAAYEGKNRLFLIFAPDVQNKIFEWQEAEMKQYEKGLEERDVVVKIFFDDRENTDELRKELGAPKKGYAAVFVDKDGEVKYVQDKPVALLGLFAVIDATPLRKKELGRL